MSIKITWELGSRAAPVLARRRGQVPEQKPGDGDAFWSPWSLLMGFIGPLQAWKIPGRVTPLEDPSFRT